MPGGAQKYQRLAYNVVQYDDGTKGIEGVCDPHLSELTHKDVFNLDNQPNIKIIDKPPYSGVNEIY